MFDNSRICRFIRDHPYDWRDLMDRKCIKVKDDGRLLIFNYDIGADFSDPMVREARGIIINAETLDVVCRPFVKFFNVQESNAAEIDWKTARVQDKIDGSLMKLWWNPAEGGWQWSTMSVINAFKAETQTGTTFGDLVKESANYHTLDYTKLNKAFTYLFELVSPDTQVVIHYPVTEIWHIGTIQTDTGTEYDFNIGVQKPGEYPLKTLDDCMEAVKDLNADGVKKEGFVVVDGNYNRVKIKSPEYLALHRSVNNNKLSAERYIDLIRLNPKEITNICELFPQHERKFRYYQWQLAEFKYGVENMVRFARRLNEEYNGERAVIAEFIKGNTYSSFGFKALGNKLTAAEMIDALTSKQISKYFKEYGT